jgi:heparinase II/III-like protein
VKTQIGSSLAHPRRAAVPLGRIRQMGLSEVAYRGQQEASKWLERLGRIGRSGDPEALLLDRAPGLADAQTASHVLRDIAPRRFFAGVQDPSTALSLSERLPENCRELVANATDTITRRRFDLLGYRSLSFGDPIDWHLDPVWARQSPLLHWSQIDPLDPGLVGDSKIVWELNRHQWVVELAQAWALTGDERYAESCIGSIDAWLDANPPGTGVNWASSLEVAFRLISWCWTLLLLRDLPALSGEWVMKVFAAIWVHAAHIRRYLSHYFSPNTHLTAEALGLFYAGALLPEFRDASQWREVGTRILISESERQISSDGVHFEQSTCYHRYTVEIYLHFLLLAARNAVTVPSQVVERARRMVDFLLAVRQPDGSIPAIGDADGGSLLPLARRSPGDSRGVFGVATAMFHRPEFAWAADGVAPEILWLLGTEGLRAFDAVRAAPPKGPASHVFPTGGYAVMRSGWTRDAHQMIVDSGPLGCHISSGHGHADLLSVQCAIFGEPCLVDAGTYCYTPESEWRDFFRSTAAHSTILVDGHSQSEPAGPFGWKRRPRARLREWHSTPDLDFLDAEHDGFLGLSDPVVHRRRVIFVKPRYWIIVDDLMGLARHQVDLTFQFAPIHVTLGPNRWARAQTANGVALWLSPFASASIRTTLRSGERLPIRGWISADYGQRRPAPTLIYSANVPLPCRILTLLLPDAQRLSSPPPVRLIYDADGLPAGLVLERSGESVRIDDRAVLVERE